MLFSSKAMRSRKEAPSGSMALSDTCRVRVPDQSDHLKMAELAHQLGYPSTEEQIAARLKDMEQSSEQAAYVAESPEGKVVGWIGGYVLRTVEMDACAVVTGLVVDSNMRSKGVGGVLLEAMEKWAYARGCRTIMVLSNTNRARAHRFYERHGYAWIKTEKLFSRPL